MANLEQQLVQVKKFLTHHTTKVRLGAVEIVAGCSDDAQLHPFFSKLGIGKQLLDLCTDSNSEISHHASLALVNLTSNPNFSLNLLNSSPFDCILKQLRASNSSVSHNSHPLKELLIKMMVNLTQNAEGVSSLLQVDSSVQGLHVIRLIHMLKSVDIRNYHDIRTMHYIPYLLCNVTQNEIGRELLMEPQRNLIRFVVPFMDYNFDYHLVETSKSPLKSSRESTKSKTTESKESVSSDAVTGTVPIGECYRIFHRGIWNLIKNCMFCLNDEPQLLMKQIKKSKGSAFMKQKDALKRVIRKYYLCVFMDQIDSCNVNSDSNANPIGIIEDQWRRNELLFEIINPIIGAFCEYPRKLRRKLKRKQGMFQSAESKETETIEVIESIEINESKDGNTTNHGEKQWIDALMKRMSFDKLRFDDLEIRQKALECLHLFCAVHDDFDLHLLFPKVLDTLCIMDLLKEYESWETEEELIRISKDIRTTLKHKLKEIKEIESGDAEKIEDETKTENVNNEMIGNETESVENQQKDRNHGDDIKGNDDDDEIKERDPKHSEENEEAKIEKMESNEQPMGQEYVGVTSSVRQTYDTKQASALFDLALK